MQTYARGVAAGPGYCYLRGRRPPRVDHLVDVA
ncbi:hypothetical protein AWB74_04176 [Caballeronia arvi]|uniref:Uncharacterized protein n=1 Tax=Caballeronia arvi TaxID=1777135 RepID=A0A158JQJ5_9BURK|nr:hypothetical protein AWB74_04176 [Caballeronia arvi]